MACFASPPLFATVEIDLMVYYTNDKYTDRDSNQQKRIDDTLIKHLVSIANTHYKNSGLDIKLRHVHSEEISLADFKIAGTVLDSMVQQFTPFNNIDSLRQEYGADVVTFLTPRHRDQDDPCGVAYSPMDISQLSDTPNIRVLINNKRYQLRKIDYGITYVRVGSYRSGNRVFFCAESTLTHELGHNMGIEHSPKQDTENEGGVFKYALGHGVVDKFVTVMPYASAYAQNKEPNDIVKKPYFSTPKIVCQEPTSSDNNQYLCGTPTESDAVKAIKQTAPIISAFYPTKVTFNDNTNDNNDRDKMEIDNTSTSDGGEDSGGSLGYLILTLIFIWCCRLWVKGRKD